MAAEYILKEGNESVMLCERGIRTFETAYRFTLDLMAVPVLKELSHLPVIVDPSHAAGRRDLVLPLSLAAAAAGADGIIVEVHPHPEQAICDGPQALVADEFADYVGTRAGRRGSVAGQGSRPRTRSLKLARRRRRADRWLDRAGRARAPRRHRGRLRPRAATRCSSRRERGAVDDAVTEIARGGRRRRGGVRRRAGGRARRPRRAALDAAPADCVISDVGSTKRAIVGGRADPRFVGGHPLAGAETSGVEHARADLFDGATWYLTPTPSTSGVLYERLHRAAARASARSPAAIEPEIHDAILATRLAPPARAGQRAGRPGRARLGRRERTPARHRSELPRRHPGGRRHQRRSGPTSTCPTATR